MMEVTSLHFLHSIIATTYIIILTAGSSRTEVAMSEIQHKPKACKIHENWTELEGWIHNAQTPIGISEINIFCTF
jgi:hypothetical protein